MEVCIVRGPVDFGGRCGLLVVSGCGVPRVRPDFVEPIIGPTNEPAPALVVRGLSFRYKERLALDQVSLTVGAGDIFGLLGPNGGGKTTLFKIIATLTNAYQGDVQVLGLDVRTQTLAIRSKLGVIFQHPSLDKKLTVRENLWTHGRLYGMARQHLTNVIDSSLKELGVWDRRDELVGSLSGGLARRAELAKTLLTRPDLLLLDEPSTGLDPGARRDFWDQLRRLNQAGVTVIVTTHLMDEAEQCHRVGILDRGRLVALGEPGELKAGLGNEILTLRCKQPQAVADRIGHLCAEPALVQEDSVVLRTSEGVSLLPKVLAACGEQVESVTWSRPSLEDVFVQKTGRSFYGPANPNER